MIKQKNLKIFSDFHHASLLNSFILLFEQRFGGEVYRPIGLEWAERGFWHVFDHPYTREQFLGIGAAKEVPPAQMYPDGTRPLNVVDKVESGIYYCNDIDSGFTNKAITYQKFMEMDFDIVIASIPQHIEPFRRLCNSHPSHPKLIYQIGNEWNVGPHKNLIDGILASARVFIPSGMPHVVYHQEFDLSIFRCKGPTIQELPRRAYSFVNCFSLDQLFRDDFLQFERVEKLIGADWEFRVYGGQCRDGAAHGSAEVAERMREASVVWHVKRGGDGYGHVLHNAAASGTPLVVNFGYYAGKLGSDLLVPDETCITIDGLSDEAIINKLHHFVDDPVRYAAMSAKLYDKFKKVVDFGREAGEIKRLLESL